MSDFGFDTKMHGGSPRPLGHFNFDLAEVMYYLYLPVRMQSVSRELRLPPNVECCRALVQTCLQYMGDKYEYAYLSARKGWATPDNPLNRPGWHCDGFGTDDMNFVWWSGPGTRFAIQTFSNISADHMQSMRQFEEQIREECITAYPERGLYAIDPTVVHSTPLIGAPGCMRQYVKVSLSNERYNLENNSHNYLFDYEWKLHPRSVLRNDPAASQADYVAEHAA